VSFTEDGPFTKQIAIDNAMEWCRQKRLRVGDPDDGSDVGVTSNDKHHQVTVVPFKSLEELGLASS